MHETGFRQYLKSYDFWTYVSILICFWFSYGLLFPIFTLYLNIECSIPLKAVGTLHAYLWILMILFQLPTGLIADQFGRKRSFLYSTILTCAAILCLLWAKSFWMFMVSQTLFAASRAFFDGAMQAWIIDRMRIRGRTHLTGIASIEQASFGIGIIVGGLSCDVITARFGTYRASIMTVFCAMLVLVFAGYIMIRETHLRSEKNTSDPAKIKSCKKQSRSTLRERIFMQPLTILAPAHTAIDTILRQPMLKNIMGIGTMHTITFSAISTYWPLYFKDIYPAKSFAGTYNGLFTLAWICGGMITLWVVFRGAHESKIFLAGSIVGLAGHAALCFGIASSDLFLVSLGLCAFYYGYGTFIPLIKRYFNTHATSDIRATMISFYCIACALGTAIGQYAGITAISYATSRRDGFFWTWLAVSLLFCSWTLWFAGKLRRHSKTVLQN